QVEAIPEPQRAHSSVSWLRYLLLLGGGMVAFAVCWWLTVFSRDGAIYDAVKGKRPPELRYYLVDSRNTRYREEVLLELKRWPDQAAQQIEARGGNLAPALAAVLRRMGKEARPLVTVGFAKTEKKPDSPEEYLSSAVVATMNRQM